MIARAATLVAGLGAGIGMSQFPEYSQQYMQRLGGAVDELSRQIDRAESQAASNGESLDAWLMGLAEEGDRAALQAAAIRSDIARHTRLAEDLDALRGAGPFTRARLAGHLGDAEIARNAWEDFKPAVPATFEGGLFAATGFVAGSGLLAAVLAFLRGLFSFAPRRRRPQA